MGVIHHYTEEQWQVAHSRAQWLEALPNPVPIVLVVLVIWSVCHPRESWQSIKRLPMITLWVAIRLARVFVGYVRPLCYMPSA